MPIGPEIPLSTHTHTGKHTYTRGAFAGLVHLSCTLENGKKNVLTFPNPWLSQARSTQQRPGSPSPKSSMKGNENMPTGITAMLHAAAKAAERSMHAPLPINVTTVTATPRPRGTAQLPDATSPNGEDGRAASPSDTRDWRQLGLGSAPGNEQPLIRLASGTHDEFGEPLVAVPPRAPTREEQPLISLAGGFDEYGEFEATTAAAAGTEDEEADTMESEMALMALAAAAEAEARAQARSPAPTAHAVASPSRSPMPTAHTVSSHPCSPMSSAHAVASPSRSPVPTAHAVPSHSRSPAPDAHATTSPSRSPVPDALPSGAPPRSVSPMSGALSELMGLAPLASGQAGSVELRGPSPLGQPARAGGAGNPGTAASGPPPVARTASAAHRGSSDRINWRSSPVYGGSPEPTELPGAGDDASRA